MTAKSIMVFAAGLGTRMRPLTDDKPKSLIRIGHTTLLDHALSFATSSGIKTIVVNAHYRAAQIRNHVSDRDIVISEETGRPLETGGGLKQALPLLDGSPVYTLNSDAVWKGPNPLSVLASAWRADVEACVLLVPKDRSHCHPGKGDFAIGQYGRLRRSPDMIYTGAQLIATDRVRSYPEEVFSMNVVWDQMIADGRAVGVVYPGEWCDVGQPQSLPKAEMLLGPPSSV